ncbi:MAG: hypothetical protein R3E57_07705 [Porticoccaceae bacterium]
MDDITAIQRIDPGLFEKVAEAIEAADGTTAKAVIELISRFGELAALCVAACADKEDIASAAAEVKAWPIGAFAAALLEIYALTVEGNDQAKKSLSRMFPAGLQGITEVQ